MQMRDVSYMYRNDPIIMIKVVSAIMMACLSMNDG